MREVPGIPTNDPNDFYKLSAEKQRHVLDWISKNVVPRESINSKKDSTQIRNLYHASYPDEDYYLTHDEFKGAMLAAGYRFSVRKLDHPVLSDVYLYNVSQNSPAFSRKD